MFDALADIRPTMIGTQAGLGVGASTDVLLFVMCVPLHLHLSRTRRLQWKTQSAH